MRVMIFGATGMVGQGVLRECILDPRVSEVRTVGRTPVVQSEPRLTQTIKQDMFHFGPADDAGLSGFDACFFCLGASSFRMSEADYTRLTHDLTLAVAQTLVRLNPAMTFVFVSGQGTDSSEKGNSMWARVKGKTENALLRLPFKAAYMLRPGAIRALHGVQSKTASYRWLYRLGWPLWWLLEKTSPGWVTNTEKIGRVMLRLAREGAPRQILDSVDINTLAAER